MSSRSSETVQPDGVPRGVRTVRRSAAPRIAGTASTAKRAMSEKVPASAGEVGECAESDDTPRRKPRPKNLKSDLAPRTSARSSNIESIDNDNSGMHTVDGQRAEPEPRPVSRNLDPSQLYRGRARMALIRDLAMGEWSDSSIASSVGVPAEIITDFRETYANEISEVRAALAGQLAIESAGLWISKRYNRLGELQSDFEDIDLVIDVMRKNTTEQLKIGFQEGSDSMVKGDTFDTNLLLGSRRHQNLLRSKIAILRAVADELAPRNNKKDDDDADGSQIRYVIEQDGGSDDIMQALT